MWYIFTKSRADEGPLEFTQSHLDDPSDGLHEDFGLAIGESRGLQALDCCVAVHGDFDGGLMDAGQVTILAI